MIYSDNIKRAMNICFNAHKNDYDKAGYPYVFHPFYVSTRMHDEDSIIVALLHDVVEDHGDMYTLENLRDLFGDKVYNALVLLTHSDDIPYMEYIKRIKENNLARKVKLADLKHNSDINRLNGVKPNKYDLYIEAINYLEEC